MIMQMEDRVSKRMTLLSIVVIVIVALIAYLPALGIGFYLDDWGYVERAARMGPVGFVLHSFDPTDPAFLYTYRPLHGTLTGGTYAIFGSNPIAFHSVHIVLHLINALLLFVICRQVTPSKRIAFLSSLIYATLPVFSFAVFLISAIDVLSTLFYLSAILFWLLYLRRGTARFYIMTVVAFGLGLLAKESVALLPITLVLIDWLVVGNPIKWASFIRRYWAFALILLPYVALEIKIQPATVIYNTYGMSWGPHVLTNAVQYFTKLVFPWNLDLPYAVVWMAIAVGLFVVAIIQTRSALLVFLGIEAVLNTLPVLGFQPFVFDTRFLYLPAIVPAIVFALLIERGVTAIKPGILRGGLAFGVTALLVGLNVTGVMQSAYEYADKARVARTTFRDISQTHTTFPPDTYLYFINPPIRLRELSGMFYLRYGECVTIGGNEWGQVANWREHSNPLIYYFDVQGRPIEIKPAPGRPTSVSPALPVTFEDSIRLEGYEISSDSLVSGEPLVLLLYWRTTKKIERDYTVFIHLIDGAGQMVDGYDSQPSAGKSPTRSWVPGALMVDAIVMPIAPKVPPGQDYRLAIGLYDLTTMQRLQVIDEQGVPITETVVIAPFKFE